MILAWLAFLPRATRSMVRAPFDQTRVILTRLLLSSLPVVVVTAAASAAMLTVQAAVSLYIVGGGPLAGMLVSLGGVREVFPLLAIASLAARSGAEFASELGSMKVDQQIDAIDVMGLDSIRLLVGPRVLAATIGGPICVIFADGSGLIGSYLVGALQLGIDRGSLEAALVDAVGLSDLLVGVLKGVVLGWLVGVITTFEGLQARGGARGVGVATNRAVVLSMILVCGTSLIMTWLFYGQAK